MNTVTTYFLNTYVVQMQWCSTAMEVKPIFQVGHPKLPLYYDLTTDYKQPNNTQWFETNIAVQCTADLMVASPYVFQAPSILPGGHELMLAQVEAHNARSLLN